MATLPTTGNRTHALAKLLNELEGIDLHTLPQEEALAAVCRLAIHQHNTKLAEQSKLQAEHEMLNEQIERAGNMLRIYQQDVVAPVAMRYAITHDWCDLVRTALFEMGVDLPSPKVKIKVNVTYEFTASVHYDHVKALKDAPSAFVAKHLHVPSLILEGVNEGTMTAEGPIDPVSVDIPNVEWDDQTAQAMNGSDVRETAYPSGDF